MSAPTHTSYLQRILDGHLDNITVHELRHAEDYTHRLASAETNIINSAQQQLLAAKNEINAMTMQSGVFLLIGDTIENNKKLRESASPVLKEVFDRVIEAQEKEKHCQDKIDLHSLRKKGYSEQLAKLAEKIKELEAVENVTKQ